MSEVLLIFFGPDDDSCHCIHLKEPRDRRNILPYRLHTGKSKKTACKGIYSVAARPARRDSAPGLRQRGWGFSSAYPALTSTHDFVTRARGARAAIRPASSSWPNGSF